MWPIPASAMRRSRKSPMVIRRVHRVRDDDLPTPQPNVSISLPLCLKYFCGGFVLGLGGFGFGGPRRLAGAPFGRFRILAEFEQVLLVQTGEHVTDLRRGGVEEFAALVDLVPTPRVE